MDRRRGLLVRDMLLLSSKGAGVRARHRHLRHERTFGLALFQRKHLGMGWGSMAQELTLARGV